MNKLLIVITCILFTACATQKPNQAQLPASTDTKSAEKVKTTAPEVNSLTSAELTAKHLEAEKAEAAAKAAKLNFSSKSIYFDYDKDDIKPEYRVIVEQLANLLTDQRNVIVAIQGNTDERGSAAYNIALGDKRARSVQKALALLGVQASQINVVSFGSEKPKLECHAEKCWHENRRVDFVSQ